MPEHGAASRPYDCPRCGVKFFFRAELDNHAFLHLDSDAANISTQAQAYHEQQKVYIVLTNWILEWIEKTFFFAECSGVVDL